MQHCSRAGDVAAPCGTTVSSAPQEAKPVVRQQPCRTTPRAIPRLRSPDLLCPLPLFPTCLTGCLGSLVRALKQSSVQRSAVLSPGRASGCGQLSCQARHVHVSRRTSESIMSKLRTKGLLSKNLSSLPIRASTKKTMQSDEVGRGISCAGQNSAGELHARRMNSVRVMHGLSELDMPRRQVKGQKTQGARRTNDCTGQSKKCVGAQTAAALRAECGHEGTKMEKRALGMQVHV